jgi:hypothetical protein
MTLAYSFSAPTATIAPGASDAVGPADAEEQALASSAMPSGTTAIRNLRRLRMSELLGGKRGVFVLVRMIMVLNFACNTSRGVGSGKPAPGGSDARRKG